MRAELRELQQRLGATGVAVSFERRRGQYRLLSYDHGPARHHLAEGPPGDLRVLALARIRQVLPRTPPPDGRRDELSWNQAHDRVEIGY